MEKYTLINKYTIVNDGDADIYFYTSTFTPSYTGIDEIGLSIRTYNCLKRAGIDTLGELRNMTDEELKRVRNMGLKSFEEIKEKLRILKEGYFKQGYDEPEYDLGSCTPLPELTEGSYMEMLEKLTGLGKVKEQVKNIAAYARMNKDFAENGKRRSFVSMNMEFVGNPGTAKTTVARLLAGILGETGVLPRHAGLVEVGRADLVGRYEGQTAIKVKEVFERAAGKLLFIDEAYSLVEVWEGAYGDEAISTIVQEMENNRDKTIVIFAGYPDKMKEFIARNPGLRSRVPFRITFEDYSAEDMVKIAESEAEKNGFSIDEKAKEKILSICETTAGNPESGNGRFCRNLVEGAILGYAGRVYGYGVETAEKDCVLRAEDFSVPEFINEEEEKGVIGFRM